jgi:CRISPR-associated protein Cas5t
MLLSLVGETDRLRHVGAELAIALLSTPDLSVVLRTLWRIKSKKRAPGTGENKRPDFQELLTHIQAAIWLRPGREEVSPTLCERVRGAFAHPNDLVRFGGLSLGESTHLVDEVRALREGDATLGRMLVAVQEGNLSLPVWPDHVGSASTRWGQYRLEEMQMGEAPPEAAWVSIQQPTGAG